MRLNNTNNLIQVEGGEKIKQADKGSWLSFLLTDTKRNPIEGINGNTAKVVLYDKDRNKGWSYSTSVNDNKVRFKLPGNLEIGIYDLDITVNNMVFPSDRNTKIEIVEGATSFSGAGISETLLELAGYAKISDLDRKVDKVSGKGLSTNDYTSADKSKVSAIPSSPKYTDTTYRAGSGLSLTGTTFSVDSTIARKSDISSGVDLSEYAKKSDIPDIDSLGNIDLSSYASKTDLSNKVDKVSGKGLSTNDYTTTDKNKVSAIPASPKYTDTIYRAGSGLSLSGNTFSVDSSVAKKSDIDNIKFPRVYTNDDTDRGTARSGKDYYIRDDGRFGKVSSVDKVNNSLSFITKFDFSQLNNLYLPGDIDMEEATKMRTTDDPKKAIYDRYYNHYYLSKEGYLAKIRDYNSVRAPGERDYRPYNNYIKLAIEVTEGYFGN